MTVVPVSEKPPSYAPAKVATSADIVVDEVAALKRIVGLKRSVGLKSWIITGLVALFLIILPFAQPGFIYYARNPEGQTTKLAALDMPNMTNRAIISWATTSVTEIMTMGFGDMDVRLQEQKGRFTKGGWKAFSKAFEALKIADTFKHSQLVLTTVPSNTPIIVGQGVNPQEVYQWEVQMPVIMSYATNNNVINRKRSVITLTIVRVPADENASGIAIQGWSAG